MPPVPYVIDITRLMARRLKGRRPTGVDRVGLAYVAHYGAQAMALVRLGGRWLFFPVDEAARLFAALGSDAPVVQAAARRLLVWRALSPARAAPPRGAWLINAVHSGLERPDYAQRLAQHGLRALCVVHDLIPLTHPHLCREGEATRHAARIHTVLRHAHAVVANSFDTLRALQAHALRQGQALPPSTVAHLGVDNEGAGGFAAAGPNTEGAGTHAPYTAPDGQRGAYFLTVGTIEPRKNHALLLDVWQRWVDAAGSAAVPRLVVVGQRGWLCDEIMQRLARGDAQRTRVLYRGGCDDAELQRWMAGAQALLLATQVEGYGLPLVEALAQGVPVIASDLPVFHEVAGAIPEYVAAHRASAWSRTVADYAQPCSSARAAQLRRLALFRAPRWAEHFARVDALLEQADVRAA